MRKLCIDDRFERLSLPISKEEYDELKNSICNEGCQEPIIVWNNIILDGHKRYQICRTMNLEFQTLEKAFSSVEKAIIWVCHEKAAKIPEKNMAFRYLIGKMYKCKLKINKLIRKRRHENKDIGQSPGENSNTPSLQRASVSIAEEYKVHQKSVEKYALFAAVMDVIADKEPILFTAIMAGTVSLGHKKIVEMSKWQRPRIKAATKQLLENAEIKRWEGDLSGGKSKKEKEMRTDYQKRLSVGIKETPAFDPDMEFRGLAFTIPTWTTAIIRAREKTDIAMVSSLTKEQLVNSLHYLEDQILQTLEAVQ